MADSEIKITIKSALDAAGIEATKSQISALSKSLKESMSGAAREHKTHWADIKAAWDLGISGLKAALGGLKAMVKESFKFETQTTQFKMLLGDIDAAKAHMQDLKALGDTPPFSLDAFAAASRSMLALTDGVLGAKASLEMVGDAAAATGQPVERMGEAVGRLYAAIRDGAPVSRAASELKNMGALTPGVVEELNSMQKAGANVADIWGKVTERLHTFSGAMAETESTGEGLMGAIESRWQNILRQMGDAANEQAQGGLQTLLAKLKQLEQDGTLEPWGRAIGTACELAGTALAKLLEWVKPVSDAFSWLQDAASKAGAAIGGFAGGLIESGSWSDAVDAAKDAMSQIEREIEMRHEEAYDHVNATAEASQQKRLEEEQRLAEEQKKITENLAEAQKKIEADAAEAAAQKAAEEAEKAAQKAEEAAAKAARKAEEEAEAAAQKAAEAYEKAMADLSIQSFEDWAKEQAAAAEEALKDLNDRALDELDDALEEARRKLDQWERNAKDARGKDFNSWNREQKQKQKDEEKEKRRQEHETQKAEEELERIQQKRDRGGKALTKQDLEREKELRDWLMMQDPQNNPFKDQVDALNMQRNQLLEELRDQLRDVHEELQENLRLC